MLPENPSYRLDRITTGELFSQSIWIIRDGLRQWKPGESATGDFTYDHFFEGGRVGILIQVVNCSGGITVIPETHTDLIMYSQQRCLRPITDPVPSRTVSLVIRSDYIHQAKLNAVAAAIRGIIPPALQEPILRKGKIVL